MADKSAPGHSPRHWGIFLLLLIVAAAAVLLVGWLPRHRREATIDQEARSRTQAVPRVQAIRVEHAPPAEHLMVPGTSQAYVEATIYARASGYLSRRLVDIGDRVHIGQLLAVIDAPDLDKQVAQARSNLLQSESNLTQMEAQLHLASVTWDRYKVLVNKGVFSRQDGDTQEANFRVSEAKVRAAQNTVQANRDNLERLIVLQQFERVTAPFNGVITQRNVDVGALITAQGSGLGPSDVSVPGSTQSAAQGNNGGASGNLSSNAGPSTGGVQGGALFSIASTDRLRILVSVPEAYANSVQVGQRAQVFFDALPNRSFEARVTRTSASIDQNTRTLLVEVQVANPKGLLMPGMYAVVNFVQMKDQPPLLIPGESIIVRNGKTVVAVVGENGIVHFQPVTIGRDYGNETEITSGLKAGDIIVRTVSDEVQDGAKIEPQFIALTQQPGGQTDRHPPEEGRHGSNASTKQ
jgi:multidrug efflux pump subunit AcrA (membrane-fusion protein)